MTPEGSAARRLRNRALMCAALVLVVLVACEGSPEPTEQAIPLPPTPVLWQEQWLAHSEGGANGIVAEAIAVRGRAAGADLWIKCYEGIWSTEVEILFRFGEFSTFAGERFEATAAAATRAELGSFSTKLFAEATAEAGDAGAQATAEAAQEALDAHGATAEAALAAATAEAARVHVLVATAGASRPTEARASARAHLQRIFHAAANAEDSIDQIFISRRATGEPGRWMKSGWKHYLSTWGYLVLEQAPAAAFIQQLSEVEEFAVLVTHDSGEDTAAVFDVRHLNAALGSAGWDC